MENKPGGFDRANGQGQNHDIDGNIENVNKGNIGPGDGEDTDLSKGNQPTEQDKPDDVRVDTVTPDNDSGDPGPSTDKGATADQDTSNKGQGPAGENL